MVVRGVKEWKIKRMGEEVKKWKTQTNKDKEDQGHKKKSEIESRKDVKEVKRHITCTESLKTVSNAHKRSTTCFHF